MIELTEIMKIPVNLGLQCFEWLFSTTAGTPTIRKYSTESVCILLYYFSDHYVLIKLLGEEFPLLDININ